MLTFFNRTYKTRNTYKMTINNLLTVIKTFETNETVISSYIDFDRFEGFFQGKMYYLTFELHQTDSGIILETTTTCKLPFYIPKTYTDGFIQFINIQKDKS